MTKLKQAVEKSGLTEEQVIERALKLWNELYDLEKAGWKFTMRNEIKKSVIPIASFELIQDDKEAVNDVDTIINKPEQIINAIRLNNIIKNPKYQDLAGEQLADYIIDNNIDCKLNAIDAYKYIELGTNFYYTFFNTIKAKAPEKFNSVLNMRWQFDFAFQQDLLKFIKSEMNLK